MRMIRHQTKRRNAASSFFYFLVQSSPRSLRDSMLQSKSATRMQIKSDKTKTFAAGIIHFRQTHRTAMSGQKSIGAIRMLNKLRRLHFFGRRVFPILFHNTRLPKTPVGRVLVSRRPIYAFAKFGNLRHRRETSTRPTIGC